jgi:hypothetical protein
MTAKVLESEGVRPNRFRWRASINKSRRRLWQRWHNPAGHTTPAFLVGSGRSGTNMIVKGLARSWQVELYNENNPAVFDNWYLRDFPTIEALIERSFARLILFKPLKDTYRTRVLLSAFPSARVLFIFRHFDDVINSARKRFYDEHGQVIKNVYADRQPPVIRWINTDFAEFTEAPPPKATEQLVRSLWTPTLNLQSNIALDWLFTNRLFFDLDLCADERIKLIQYEAVVSDPQQGFKSLCQFLGLPFEPQIAGDVFSTSVKRDPVPDLDPQIQAACEAHWQQMCQYLGT